MSFNRNINNTTNSITYQTAKDDVLVYFVFSQIYILLMYSLRCWLDMIGLVAIAYVLWQLNDNGHRLSATGKWLVCKIEYQQSNLVLLHLSYNSINYLSTLGKLVHICYNGRKNMTVVSLSCILINWQSFFLTHTSKFSFWYSRSNWKCYSIETLHCGHTAEGVKIFFPSLL